MPSWRRHRPIARTSLSQVEQEIEHDDSPILTSTGVVDYNVNSDNHGQVAGDVHGRPGGKWRPCGTCHGSREAVAAQPLEPTASMPQTLSRPCKEPCSISARFRTRRAACGIQVLGYLSYPSRIPSQSSSGGKADDVCWISLERVA